MLDKIETQNPLIQLINIDDISRQHALKLLMTLRNLKIKVRYDYKTNLKKSLSNANESNIKYAILIGESELKNNNYTLKNLLDGSQQTLSYTQLLNTIRL